MNAGTATIDWLYRDQLQVDAKWSIRKTDGFTWWPDRNAQHIEVIAREFDPDGNDAYCIRVKTDLVRDLHLTETALAAVSALMSTATMAGPVYDTQSRMLSLSSLVRVHEGIREWMSPLISIAAMLQISHARKISSGLADRIGGTTAASGHPENGPRPSPDELALSFAPLISRTGQQPSAWATPEFKQAVAQHMHVPPALLATCSDSGLTVEFPYGDGSSLCQMKGNQAHSLVGQGLFLLQSFPIKPVLAIEGTKLALELNAEELHRKPAGYGLGSYCYRDQCIHFVAFFPNLAYRAGLLPNFYFACAARAQALSVRFKNDDWSAASSRWRAPNAESAVARFLSRFSHK